MIVIGISEKDIPTFQLPGLCKNRWGYRGDDGGCFEHKPAEGLEWPHGSNWGYHGDDGHCYAQGEQHKLNWKEFGTGDTVGCGVEWKRNKEGKSVIYFTRNGDRLSTTPPLHRRKDVTVLIFCAHRTGYAILSVQIVSDTRTRVDEGTGAC